jgi:hypothetical protein
MLKTAMRINICIRNSFKYPFLNKMTFFLNVYFNPREIIEKIMLTTNP